MKISSFELDEQELTRHAAVALGITLESLVFEGYLTDEKAEEFAGKYTIVLLHKKSVFYKLKEKLFPTDGGWEIKMQIVKVVMGND